MSAGLVHAHLHHSISRGTEQATERVSKKMEAFGQSCGGSAVDPTLIDPWLSTFSGIKGKPLMGIWYTLSTELHSSFYTRRTGTQCAKRESCKYQECTIWLPMARSIVNKAHSQKADRAQKIVEASRVSSISPEALYSPTSQASRAIASLRGQEILLWPRQAGPTVPGIREFTDRVQVNS